MKKNLFDSIMNHIRKCICEIQNKFTKKEKWNRCYCAPGSSTKWERNLPIFQVNEENNAIISPSRTQFALEYDDEAWLMRWSIDLLISCCLKQFLFVCLRFHSIFFPIHFISSANVSSCHSFGGKTFPSFIEHFFSCKIYIHQISFSISSEAKKGILVM